MKLGVFLFGLAAASVATADLPEGKTPGSGAEVSQGAGVVDAVQKKYAGVSSMKAAFVQTTHSDIFGADEQSGDVVLERPAKMRWDFPKAGKQFVTDGATMWVYTAEDKQVLQFDDVSGQADTAQALLHSLDRLDQIFDVTVAAGADASKHTLDLAPKTPGQVKAVRLVLTTDLLVEHVTITDAYDQVTELAFSDVKLNVEVPDAVFTFVVPPGVELITAGGM